MDPVTMAAVAAAAISAVGTVLAAWIQSRAQRSGRGDQRPAGPGEPTAGTSAVTSRESEADDRR
jgi:hypothetical protein